jgi:hypothetical protein
MHIVKAFGAAALVGLVYYEIILIFLGVSESTVAVVGAFGAVGWLADSLRQGVASSA